MFVQVSYPHVLIIGFGWLSTTKTQTMQALPTDSPKKEKIVFFADEGEILTLIKNEDTSKLMQYFNENGCDKKLMIRFVGYSINMIKPFSFKCLCLMDMTLIPYDVMKRVFHVILCEHQDNVSKDRMDYLVLAARQIAEFLVEYNQLHSDDVNDAIDIYKEYKMEYMDPLVSFLKKNVGNSDAEIEES